MRAIPKWKLMKTARYAAKNLMAGEAIPSSISRIIQPHLPLVEFDHPRSLTVMPGNRFPDSAHPEFGAKGI